jgi:hypothetical protein
MHYRVQDTGQIGDSGGMRYSIINDAEIAVAWTEFRSVADAIAAMLSTDGRDWYPTPAQEQVEIDRDHALRKQRDLEEFGPVTAQGGFR